MKDLRRLDRSIVPRVVAAAETLSEDPRPSGSRKLTGSQDLYRIRVGDYRIIYSLDDVLFIVGIERVRHRGDAGRR